MSTRTTDSRLWPLLIVLAALTLVVSGAVPGHATPNTKLLIIQDSAGCGGVGQPVCGAADSDMAGPSGTGNRGFGFVNYNQNAEGELRVVVALKNATPNTTYEIFLVCGPTHATACGFITIGFLTTNGQGNGNSGAIHVPVTTLQAPPFGSGARTDHVDLLASVGDLSAGFYAATPVSYIVP